MAIPAEVAVQAADVRCAGVVYVHCWGGKGRTCTVIGCRLIDGGLDGGPLRGARL